MVIIALKSQFVSLIVTLVSCAAELCLLHAALALNQYLECVALKRGHQVNVRRHRTRVKALTLCATAMFVILEVTFSFYTDPAFVLAVKPCIAVDRYDVRSEHIDRLSYDIPAALFNCELIVANQTFQRGGYMSTQNSETHCDRSPVFKFEGSGRVSMPIRDNQTKSCAERTCIMDHYSGLESCIDHPCVYIEVQSRQLLLSELLEEDEIPMILRQGREISYIVSELFSDIDKNHEAGLGQRALMVYAEGASDTLGVLRGVLMGSEETMCTLSNEATELQVSLITIMTITWGLSLLAFISAQLSRRHIFYNISDPLHWAQRTYRNIDEPVSDNPVIISLYEHGKRFMYVSSKSSGELNLCKRIWANFQDRFGHKMVSKSESSVEKQHSMTLSTELGVKQDHTLG